MIKLAFIFYEVPRYNKKRPNSIYAVSAFKLGFSN